MTDNQLDKTFDPAVIEDALMAFVCDYAARPENAKP